MRSPDAADEVRLAAKVPLLDEIDARGTLLSGEGIEKILPHRGDARLVATVCSFDPATATAVGIFDGSRNAAMLAGHFPGRPVVPGLLLVEALGQLGAIAFHLLGDTAGGEIPALTEVLGARFVRPVDRVEEIFLVSRVDTDGMFRQVLGQCIVGRRICCSAALRGY